MSSARQFRERGGFWMLAQILVLVITLLSPRFLDSYVRWSGNLHRILGGAVALVGLLFCTAAVVVLGKNLTPMPSPKDHASLVTTGVYQWVRHPIYGGICLMSSGYCLGCHSVLELVLAGLILLFFDQKASREEQWLAARYPSYAGYARRTKKLIPWIY